MMISVAGLASLCACGSPSKAQLASSGITPAPASFSVETPIDKIAADERGKAVLDRDVPGVMSNPHYVMFSCMSLSQLATLSGGRLTKSKLSQVNSDLAELSPGQ
ncbi:MAG: hypothetical protein KGH91_02610 [Rhodospirillales bacterium]|nr:hypothetical protein [Rhodospirillales bacterium]